MATERQVTIQAEMLSQECTSWQELIHQRCGLHFSESRLQGLHRCLRQRMRLCRMQSYREYYRYVASQPSGSGEWQALLDLLLNNETGFFRHLPSFTALTQHVLPELMCNRPHYMPIKMWSAGCSMGQEAYSLAVAFLETTAPTSAVPLSHLRSEPEWQVAIKGSDISQRALRKARQGQYKPHEARSLPGHYLQHYFTALGEGRQVVYQVIPQVQQMVEFGYVNLHDPDSSPFSPLPFIGGRGEGVDVIFCQNVLIYFTPADRAQIVKRLCQRLRPEGYLFLGPAEAIGLTVAGMEPVRLDDTLIYRCAR
ncbi:MAG: protein-glutamate O-methyltransferase CheR [Candidatus Tectomicrobia bacterium]|nr:protein-glutamate O-methyltransferase CheR [Candidatus Tectomicrobia bacterium]